MLIYLAGPLFSAAERSFHERLAETIGAYKVGLHREFLRTWAAGSRLDAGHVWRVREECTGALSGRDPGRRMMLW